MVSHKKPSFAFSFDVGKEKAAIDAQCKKRKLPARKDDRLIVGTWNLTNFGKQEREPRHLELMAHVLSKFDVVAVQEIADDLTHLRKLVGMMGGGYRAVFSDTAGNQERAAFIFDAGKVEQVGLVAELAMRGNERGKVTITVGEVEETHVFDGFNRNPYMATFRFGSFEFTLVNVHLYWSDTTVRHLETKALGKWAKSRSKKKAVELPSKEIMLIGDFNMPALSEDDPFYSELTGYGLQAPLHRTEFIGSNLAGDKNYDQLFFFPKHTDDDFVGQVGVLDFDATVFSKLWKPGTDNERFFQYVRYYMADHRPLWAVFRP